MKITVFTATYNRGYCLNKLYDSLKNQTYKNFEWIVIDDGSKDDTEEIINSFIHEGQVCIRFAKQANRGKHIAINSGVQMARGEYFFIVDSDDKLPHDSLEIISNNIKNISKTIGGVAGRAAHFDGTLVGNSFSGSILSNAIDIRYKYKVSGDLVEVFKTEIMKEFPFPEFPDERFCPEVVVWNRIATKYQLLFFNQIIYYCEYLEDGLTSKIINIRMNSPEATMLTYAELERYNIPLFQKIRANINFWRFSYCSNRSFLNKVTQISKFHSLIGIPIGYILHRIDKHRTK
jgi:glycosyltransferase involved in cell wall biosynthesis